MGLPLTPAKIIADFCKFSLFVDRDIGELQPQTIRGRRLIQATSSFFRIGPFSYRPLSPWVGCNVLLFQSPAQASFPSDFRVVSHPCHSETSMPAGFWR